MPNTLKQNVDRVKAAKTAISNAIVAAGGTVNQGDGLEEFATDIGTITPPINDVIEAVNGELEAALNGDIVPTSEKGTVTFYDYDGTVVAEYTNSQFLALDSLPSNPSHIGLTAQGWNWSLADAKDYVEKYGSLDIGQMYITSDGKTRLYITLTEGRTEPLIDLYLNANSSVNVDWGDNSTISTLSTTSAGHRTERHTYATPGDYVIAIEVTAGSFSFQSNSNSEGSILTDGKQSLNSSDRAYLNSIIKIEMGSGISTIGARSFFYCYSLKSITIPNTITEIGTYAFDLCIRLDYVVIPYGVTSIATYAFSQSYFKRVLIPKSVQSIGSYAFNNCPTLKSLMFPNNASFTIIDQYICYSCYNMEKLIIPNTVTRIKQYAFHDCHSLKNVKFPNSLTTLDDYIFENCTTLESVELPNSVTTIGTSVFRGCQCLKSVKLSSGMTTTGNSTFRECYALDDVTIPDGITEISGNSFCDCRSLESIVLPNTLTTLASSALQNCWSLREITLPNTLTTIQSSVFSECYTLASINIPSSVVFTSSFGSQFSTCTNVTKVTLPNNLTYIPQSFFSNGYSLKEITIPSSVTEIGKSAFSGCSGITNIRFEPIAPPVLGSSAFLSVPTTCLIYVPEQGFYDYIIGTNYPSVSSYRYIPYGTYANGTELPTRNKELNYGYTWYASIDDLIAETNPISVGNGSEVYAKITLLTRINRYTVANADVTSSDVSTNTATIQTTVGDLVIASFIVSYTDGYTITESGWTVLGTSDPTATGNARLIVVYKTAESTSETITVTSDAATRMNINMIAITGGQIGTLSTFGSRNGTGYNVEETKPTGLVLWGVYSRVWSTSTKRYWTCNETREPYMTLSQTQTFPRLLTAIDQSPNESQTFVGQSSNANNNFIWYSLTITGIPNFWYYE